jgi:hypothetical protein
MKVTGPCLSLSAGPPLRKKRTPWGQTILTPAVEHVIVTAGDPAADPDCTGTYLYFQDFDEQHAYRREPDHAYYLFYDAIEAYWTISDTLQNYADNRWINAAGQPGEYSAYTGAPQGNAIASAPIT